VLDVEYLPRLLSDHSPLLLSISIPTKVNGVYRWRLNSTLLKQPEFCAFIKEQINIFTLTNKPPDSFILWDTLKAYLRGQIISYTKGLKKKHCAELSALESEISELERTYQRGPTKDLYRLLTSSTKLSIIFDVSDSTLVCMSSVAAESRILSDGLEAFIKLGVVLNE
jgi:hypothetical protein